MNLLHGLVIPVALIVSAVATTIGGVLIGEYFDWWDGSAMSWSVASALMAPVFLAIVAAHIYQGLSWKRYDR